MMSQIVDMLGETEISNEPLLGWVREMAALCEAARIVWCDGSKSEYDSLCELMVQEWDLYSAQLRKAARMLSCAIAP